ncbi:hypothetical protein L1049_008217 [Liquidambar formosana]|uniref:SWIM-type domain-containing protein n=1 Tax=Liquidambar formosana TaxID=63359 RepID=A0AAP0S649_LIQFO
MELPLDDSVEQLEWKPRMGMEFDIETKAYDYNNEYCRRVGFNIRRQYRNMSKTHGCISTCLYVCSNEGVLRKKGNELVMAEEAGLSIRDTYSLMSTQVGGRESLRFTKLNQKNYLRSRRMSKLAYGEAGSLMRYFKEQTLKNPSFYHAIQFDNEEQITNIFWVDARMIIDYSQFGDVVSFDTTYKINKEHRPFAVFVGLNHHREVVIFGAALMYDETIESFEWLFQTFLEAMSNRVPQTIITDQDAAMAKAIPNVMPNTFHRLCKWHIMQNATKHVSRITTTVEIDSDMSTTSVKGKLAYFMDHIDEEADFLAAWEQMLDDYDVRCDVDDGENTIYMVCNDDGRGVVHVKKCRSNDHLSCSCRLFKISGILCRHALKVFREVLLGGKLPAQYILKRWTRDARSIYVHDMLARNTEANGKLEEADRYSMMMTGWRKLADMAAKYEDAYHCIIESQITLQAKLEAVIHAHLNRKVKETVTAHKTASV